MRFVFVVSKDFFCKRGLFVWEYWWFGVGGVISLLRLVRIWDVFY